MFHPKYNAGSLKDNEMGARRIKLDPVRKGPNVITFNDETVMSTYPEMLPEYCKCAQDTHTLQDCQAIYCDNCKGFTSHENLYTTMYVPNPVEIVSPLITSLAGVVSGNPMPSTYSLNRLGRWCRNQTTNPAWRGSFF